MNNNQLSLKLFINKLVKDYPAQCDRVLNSDNCEIEPSFLGFLSEYHALAKIIPKSHTVIDLGCYAAAQAFYFRKHAGYIGVDIYEGERFRFENTSHFVCSIEDFLRKFKRRDNCFAICNYVPIHQEERLEIARKFQNIFFFYPCNT